MKRGKVVRYEGMKLPNKEVIGEVQKEGYIYLGIVELDKIKNNISKKKNNKGMSVINT